MRKAVFPGSFNPFTIGHWDIVNRAIAIFDKVIIAVGNNIEKSSSALDTRVRDLQDLYSENDKVEIVQYSGLTADLVKHYHAHCILRGIRNIKDVEYEKNLATINKQMFGIDTLFLFTDPNYAHISSSVVRELRSFHCDVSSYLPPSEH